MARQPVEMNELQQAGYEFSRQLERLAVELCEKREPRNVWWIVQQQQAVERMLRVVEMRFGGRN
jgi:hypothetical protein